MYLHMRTYQDPFLGMH
jgi:hypothetical protein